MRSAETVPSAAPDRAAVRKRRRVVGATAVVGAGALGVSLATQPGSPRFFALTAVTAATWVVGGLASGPVPLGWARGRSAAVPAGRMPAPPPRSAPRRPVVGPVLIGVGAFGGFYGAALVARRIPVLDRAIAKVLRYADQGTGPLVVATALVNGAAEEVFFRGALYAALEDRTGGPSPVAASTAAYVLATVATRNPALVLASGVMGALFARQRAVTGGIQAPLLTHVTWSALMLRFLPPLFRRS